MAKFERKILKKTIETAEEQELALAVLRAQPVTIVPPSVNLAPVPSISSPRAVAVDADIKPTSYKEKYPKQTQRINLDLPQDLYDAVQEHIRRNGQTMKGFFVIAASDYIANSRK